MKLMVQYFEWYVNKEDNLWIKLENDADLLKELGVTHVWMPPAYKGKSGDADSGYGVYDLYDFGEFDQKGAFRTKYGTKEEYEQALEALDKRNINAIADIVLNHKIGADYTEKVLAYEHDELKRNVIVAKKEIEAWTGYHFCARKNKYSSFTWNKKHFTSVDFDNLEKRSGLFRFNDKEWASNIDEELTNYDYLMGADVDFSNSEVVDHYNEWGNWYTSNFLIDGFRLDAVKHIDFNFFSQWLTNMRKHRDLFVVGEYWSSDLRALNNYLMETEFSMTLFDVPLHFNLYDASVLKESYDLRTIFNGTLVLNHSNYAVTFVDNHDTQEGQSLESMIEPWFRDIANAFILLRDKGIPCVFYKDLYEKNVQTMMKLRTSITSIRFDYFDEHDCVGWSYANPHSLAVLISNKDTRLKKMFVGKEHAHETFVDVLNNCEEEVVIDEKGIGIFKVNRQSISIYTKKGRIQ